MHVVGMATALAVVFKHDLAFGSSGIATHPKYPIPFIYYQIIYDKKYLR